MNYSAIIFDLDGTLLNTIDDLANAMNFVLEQHHYPVHTVEEYKYFVGNGMDNLTRRALPPTCQDESIVAACLDEFQTRYGETWHNFTKPYPGIAELLDSLKALGIRMSILSNKNDQFTQVMIDYYFGLDRFEYVYGARAGVPKKPDPTAALDIARFSKLATSEFLYLGDSGVDMQTANSAGMFALGAAWGFRDINEMTEYGLKRLIYDPMEIVELIKGLPQ
jgi:phosphoglycolate phosphatase